MKDLLAMALNKTLSLDPESFERLKKLDHRTLRFTIQPIDLILSFKITAAGFEAVDIDHADIMVTGKPSDFIKLAQQKNPNLYHSGVRIVGDMGLAEEIKTILMQLDLDWEALVAEYTGDVAARQIGRATRAGLRWGKQTHANLRQDVLEYLQEEIRILPTRVEMETFTDDNNRLRDDVARLEAKLK